jgi:uncharacterized protein (TIGR00730 family)
MKDTAKEGEKVYIDKPFDFAENANWRIFRIMAEFVEGFEFLYPLRREVTIFGSAQLAAGSKWYEEARKFSRILAEGGYTVITGGGPGIMEAGNRGAYEAGGNSIGLDIELATEQRRNKYVTKGIGFHYFFTRKVMLTASAQAYVFFPGGFGTLDELFEMTMLVQTGKMERVPIICVGSKFWEPLDSWIRNTLKDEYKTINSSDMGIYKIVNSAEEAAAIVKKSKERKYF